MDAGAEAALGARLFDLFLASSWQKIRSAVPSGSTRFLTIDSDASEILNLPWELLLPPEGDFLGLDARFAIRRLPGSEKKLESFSGELRPRPLRLLFMACAPTDQATLDYEREEEALFRAVSGQDVAFDSCDLYQNGYFLGGLRANFARNRYLSPKSKPSSGTPGRVECNLLVQALA